MTRSAADTGFWISAVCTLCLAGAAISAGDPSALMLAAICGVIAFVLADAPGSR